MSDDDYTYFSIPFTVTFYDQEYDHIAVGSNGHVYFEDNYLGMSNKPIPSDSGYGVNRFLAGLWDDLNPGSGGEIYWEVLGSAPERRLVVQFEGVPHYSNISAVSFEIIFYENSEQMQYLDVDFGNSSYDYGASATVGVQRDSSFGQQYSYNQPALHDQMAIRWYREAGPVEPVPDIKANGSDDTLFVTPSESVDISISLDPGDMAGEWADWWIGIMSPYGTFQILALPLPLFELAETSLFEIPLPVGLWVFYFILDDNPNGIFDRLTWYDYVVVAVSSEGLEFQTEALPNFEAFFQEKIRRLMKE